MALIVARDDGLDYADVNGVRTRVHADSYVSVEYARNFVSQYSVEMIEMFSATASEEAIEKLLRDGTTHINLRFQNLFGQKANVQVDGESLWRQLNEFPRINCTAGDGQQYNLVIPEKVKRATVKYAIRRIQGPLLPDHISTITGGGANYNVHETDETTRTSEAGGIEEIESASGSRVRYAQAGEFHSVHNYDTDSLRNPQVLHEQNIYPEADYEMQVFIRTVSRRGIRQGRIER